MKKFTVNKRVLYTALSALVMLIGTIVAIEYAKGNFRVTESGFRQGTGLLAANSFPPGAEVYIDGKLTTATDDTLYVDPGTYTVEILRDGYTPWKKAITIEKELVTQTNAKLFPVSPSLTALTFTGIQNISPSPDGQKILFYTASASAQTKNGLYILELNEKPLNFQRGARQISQDGPEFNLSTAEFIWSPDSSQVLLTTAQKEVLLETGELNDLQTLPDISLTKRQLLSDWEEEMYLREREFLSKFPVEIIAVATESAKNVYISPDKKRLLYTATKSVSIPENLVPPLPIINSLPQERTLTPEAIYVYDREEDTNYKVGTAKSVVDDQFKSLLAVDLYSSQPTLGASESAFTTLQASTSAQTTRNFNRYHTSLYADTFQWYPDSKHLLYAQDNTINVMSYDGSNPTVLYAGPFTENFFYPWPDGSRLLIQTVFALSAPVNLYAIELD